MHYFVNRVIKRYIASNGYGSVCEVGVSRGEAADELLELQPPIDLSLVDPCLDVDLCGKYAGVSNVHVLKGLSLDVLTCLERKFDCIMLDGDHNWYTVISELRVIERRGLLNEGGTIFLHDVCWPYARRDMYYLPESIPLEFRQPYSRRGIVKGQSPLVESGGKCAHLANAVNEGGERNGVLTAVEDFLKEKAGKYHFFRVRVEYGLGILVRRKGVASWFLVAKWCLFARMWELLACVRGLLRNLKQRFSEAA